MMCGMPYSVRRISAEYRGVLVVCAARLAAGSGPDTGDDQAAPAITHTPVTAAISGSRRVPSRNKHILDRRENNVVIGLLPQVRPMWELYTGYYTEYRHGSQRVGRSRALC